MWTFIFGFRHVFCLNSLKYHSNYKIKGIFEFRTEWAIENVQPFLLEPYGCREIRSKSVNVSLAVYTKYSSYTVSMSAVCSLHMLQAKVNQARAGLIWKGTCKCELQICYTTKL